jgi:hypothetical protein
LPLLLFSLPKTVLLWRFQQSLEFYTSFSLPVNSKRLFLSLLSAASACAALC